MKIHLYVDDIRPAPKGWHLAKTNAEAIRILATQDVDYVSVDHDIKGAPPEESFEPVIRFIAQMAMPRPNVACHSGNVFAYDKYESILNEVGEKLYSLDYLQILIEEEA